MNKTIAQSYFPEFELIRTAYDPDQRVLWYWLSPDRPCFTLKLLSELKAFQARVVDWQLREHSGRIDYLVGGSGTPRIFNRGGDLRYFIQLIRERNRAKLLEYAHMCVEALFRNAVNLELPVTTISLVQGEALGGGFEAVLSSNVIIAERSAKMGFAEILFNLVPGMGAYSLLCRRVDRATTERILTSGIYYCAEELHKMGLVDVVAEDGEGEKAVEQFIVGARHRQNAAQLLYKIRARVSALPLEELRDVADMWTASAMRTSERDLRVMERLVGMQSGAGRAQKVVPIAAASGRIAAVGPSGGEKQVNV